MKRAAPLRPDLSPAPDCPRRAGLTEAALPELGRYAVACFVVEDCRFGIWGPIAGPKSIEADTIEDRCCRSACIARFLVPCQWSRVVDPSLRVPTGIVGRESAARHVHLAILSKYCVLFMPLLSLFLTIICSVVLEILYR